MSETKFDTLSDAVSEVEMIYLRKYVRQLKNEKIVKNKKIEKYQMDLKKLYEVISPVEGIDVELFERKDLKPTKENEKKLSSMWIMLKKVEKERKDVIGNLMQELEDLWFRHDVSKDLQDIYKSDLRPIPSTIETLESEANRCREMETCRNQLGDRIEALRAEVIEWARKSKIIDDSAALYEVVEYQQEVLEDYESLLERTKAYYEDHKTIIGFLDERQSLKLKLEALKKKEDVAKKNLSDQEKQEKTSMENQLLKVEMNIVYAIAKYEKERPHPVIIMNCEFLEIDNIASLMGIENLPNLSNVTVRKPLENISNANV